MASRTGNPFTAAQGRRFGFTVGAAFLVFAGIAWWRGHPTMTNVLASLGGVLVLAGLAIPAQLGPVERAWMGLAHLISKVTTPIVMGAMYLLVFTPIGVARRFFGGNPMVHEAQGASYWKPRPEGRRAGSLTRQY
jgi:hypothetical protein